MFRMLEEEDRAFPLKDDDIRAAVRIWLDTSHWKQRLKIVDEMSPGGLRVHHEILPDILLGMGADEGISPSINLAMEAHSALEYSDYLDVWSGERLERTEAAIQRHLREYVDRRMGEVFGQGLAAATPAPAISATAPPELAANRPSSPAT